MRDTTGRKFKKKKRGKEIKRVVIKTDTFPEQ